MIEPTRGNILTDDAEALVNTVNCVGVMGKGIALQFKKAFPENFKAYEAACRRKEVKPGRMFVFETGQMFNPRYIINFPTKRHWRGKSRYEDIESGLKALVREVRQRKIRSIAVPPLGSGLGGLQWSRVKAMIEAAFEEMPDVRVKLYEPKGSPKAKDIPVGHRQTEDDRGPGLAHQTHEAVCAVRIPIDAAGNTEARLFSAGIGHGSEAAVCQAPVWPLCP